MRTFLVGILISVAVVALIAQVALPRYIENRVRDRLKAGGGSATVSLTAIPALSLLAGRGNSFEARGSGLGFGSGARGASPFHRLDGFSNVSMELTNLATGPLRVKRFTLSRCQRHEPYDLEIEATVTARELAGGLGTAAGGQLGGLMGSLATGMLGDAGGLEIPLRLEAQVWSQEGEPQVRSARGSVGGVPAGRLAEIVLGGVLGRL